MRLGGQLRTGGEAILGYDMSAALAVGSALGVSPRAVAELLPEIEDEMSRAANARIRSRSQ